MKWLFRIFMRPRQMLRTQAALVQNQMKALHNLQLKLPLFSVFSLASGVAILTFWFIFLKHMSRHPSRQLPTAANPHQPPTANRHQPSTTNHQRPPTTTSRSPSANRHQPPAAHCQPPQTTNRQSPLMHRLSLPSEYMSQVEQQGKDCIGFNLLVADQHEVWYHSNYSLKGPRHVPAETVQGMSNAPLENPWSKTQRGIARLEPIVKSIEDRYVGPAPWRQSGVHCRTGGVAVAAGMAPFFSVFFFASHAQVHSSGPHVHVCPLTSALPKGCCARVAPEHKKQEVGSGAGCLKT